MHESEEGDPVYRPNECYFCLEANDDLPYPTACITPIAYFESHHCVYDQYIEFEGIDWLIDITEGSFEQTDVEPGSDLPAVMAYEMHTRLEAAGFKTNEAFTQFIQSFGQ